MKKRRLPDRLRTKKAQQTEVIVGVCWYTPQDWARIKETATDSEIFENTFSEWEAMATKNIAVVRTAYPKATKVLVDADEFFAWCLVRGKGNNSETRSEFVSDKIRKAG